MNGISMAVSLLALVLALLSGWRDPTGEDSSCYVTTHFHPERDQYADLVITSQIQELLNDWKTRYYPQVNIQPGGIRVAVILADGQEEAYDRKYVSEIVTLRVRRAISATEFGWLRDFAVDVDVVIVP